MSRPNVHMLPAGLAFLVLFGVALVPVAVGTGCGSGSPGPAMNGQKNEEPQLLGPDKLSNEVMMRDARTSHAVVKHILVDASDEDLAVDLLGRLRAGQAIEPLMAEFSKDPGSAETGDSYDVTPDARLVFEFKRLGLRLDVGEVGLVKTEFGWHVMKRIK